MRKIRTLLLSALVLGLSAFAPVNNNSITVEAKGTICEEDQQRLSLSDAKSYVIDSLGSSTYKKLLRKSPLEIVNRAKKIINYYNVAYADGFAHLYHPNKDLSINEEEMLQGLPNDNSLCIMLFGNKLNDDGSMSEKFLARSKSAYAMACKYPNALIMVTGGHTAGYDFPSEAVTGRKWLVDHGIDASRIVIDELSWDTGSNVLCTFTTSDLRKHTEISNFVIVSSDYHVPRCSFCLMSYIYAMGYDLPKSEGGKGYKYLGHLGAVIC